MVTTFSQNPLLFLPENRPIYYYLGGLRIPVVLVLGRLEVGPSSPIRCRSRDRCCFYWQNRFGTSRKSKEGFNLMFIVPLHTSYQSIDYKSDLSQPIAYYQRPREALQTQSVEKILRGASKDIGNDISGEITKYGTGANLRDRDVLLDGERNSRGRYRNSLVVSRFTWWGLEWVRLGIKNVCSINVQR